MKAYLKAKKYLEVYIVADNTMVSIEINFSRFQAGAIHSGLLPQLQCYTVLGLKAVPDATKSEIYGYFNSHKTVRGKVCVSVLTDPSSLLPQHHAQTPRELIPCIQCCLASSGVNMEKKIDTFSSPYHACNSFPYA